MFNNSINIKPVFIGDCTFPFGKSNNNCPMVLEEFRSMITNITQSLNNNFLSLHSNGQAQTLHNICHIANFTQAVKNTETGSFFSATNSTLGYRFTRNTTLGIDFTGAHALVSINDPCHFPFTCAIVRGRYINSRSDKILLDQF